MKKPPLLLPIENVIGGIDIELKVNDADGNPVNIASKMSQDKGRFGRLYLSAAMKDLGIDPAKKNPHVD